LTGVFAAVIAVSFFTRGMQPYARSILLVAWLLSIPAVTLGRMIARRIMSSRRWYGIPVVIVGEHGLAARIIDALRNNAHIGLRPHVIVEPDAQTAHYGYHAGVPIVGGMENGNDIIARYGITHGVIAMPHATSDMLADIVDRYGQQISHFTFVGEHVHPSVVWISNVQSDPLLSAEIEQRLRQPALRWKKRLFDVVATVPLLLFSMPFMALFAVAIKLTSKGPVLYRQRRVGEKGRVFDVLKFRTMVLDADAVLEQILATDASARDEWHRFHKLKRDPRITRVGTWLRKYSMDELPQLWNVLRGEMTLVGTRPLILRELPKLEGNRKFLDVYYITKPGLTGLWQVTLRSDAEFDVRLHIDLYYMRNWSIFLDIYILLRTVGVVISGKGAY
jgi:Undecaprenyl-phosphate galactose phosphotransferase WbaP